MALKSGFVSKSYLNDRSRFVISCSDLSAACLPLPLLLAEPASLASVERHLRTTNLRINLIWFVQKAIMRLELDSDQSRCAKEEEVRDL
jgi:hypothetical protein